MICIIIVIIIIIIISKFMFLQFQRFSTRDNLVTRSSERDSRLSFGAQLLRE